MKFQLSVYFILVFPLHPSSIITTYIESDRIEIKILSVDRFGSNTISVRYLLCVDKSVNKMYKTINDPTPELYDRLKERIQNE